MELLVKNKVFYKCFAKSLLSVPLTIVGHFRLYHAVVIHVNGQYQVTCLESVIFHGVYISWNTGSQSIEFFVSCKRVCHTILAFY